jgi:phospho-N-acetylmuramoyl-pentapeptide-transferase
VIGLLIAGGVAMLVSLFGTRFLITWLTTRSVAQPILPAEQRGPRHEHKAGTPTMGGIAVIVAATVGYLVAHIRRGVVFTNSGVVVMAAILGAALVGFLDDWIKVSNARNLGLSKKAKIYGLLLVAGGYCVGMLTLTSVDTTLSFTRSDLPGWDLGVIGWAALAVALITGFSNAMNLTDGLDGLAAGSSIFTFFAFTVIAFYVFRNDHVYAVNHGLDLAVVAIALAGGCAGFLWWNAAPARIFMGDVGSLGLGTGLAGLALALNVQLLAPIIGALYVIEVASVLMQMVSYRYFGKRRIFLISPIHHHFEMKGWPETTVIIRFWMVSGICTAVALGIFYADSVRIPGIND